MSNFNIKKDLKNIMEYEMIHPSDTHPPIKDEWKILKLILNKSVNQI